MSLPPAAMPVVSPVRANSAGAEAAALSGAAIVLPPTMRRAGAVARPGSPAAVRQETVASRPGSVPAFASAGAVTVHVAVAVLPGSTPDPAASVSGRMV